MDKKKTLKDIGDRQKTFDEIHERLKILSVGFRAIFADYRHHIEVIRDLEHDLTTIKKNIQYRFFSARFHLELFLRQHYIIEDRIQKVYSEDPKKVLNPVYPSHPLIDHCENEITAILDSILFHLGSIFDYLSALVNFICNKKDRSITKWSQLLKACRDSKNQYFQRSIKEILIEQNKNFVNKLYEYRSRVIHFRSDKSAGSISITLESGKTSANFIVPTALTNKFHEIRILAKNHDITANYIAKWLINATLNSIAEIFQGLRKEMQLNSNYPDHIGDNDLLMFHLDKETNIGHPVTKPMWEEFEKEYKKNADNTTS